MDLVVIVAVILLAILTGAAVPTLIQLSSTLRSIQRFVDRVGPRLEHALEEASKTADHLNRMAGELEGRAKRAKPLIDMVGDLGEGLVRVRSSIRHLATIGGAVGQAVGAAVKGFLGRRHTRALQPIAGAERIPRNLERRFASDRQ